MNELIWEDGNEAAVTVAKRFTVDVKKSIAQNGRCIVAMDYIPLWDNLNCALASALSALESEEKNKIFIVPLVKFCTRHEECAALYLFDHVIDKIKNRDIWDGPHVLGIHEASDRSHIKQSLSDAFRSGMVPDITIASVNWTGGVYLPDRLFQKNKNGLIHTITVREKTKQNLQLLSAQALWLTQRLFLCFPISGSQQESTLFKAGQADSVTNTLLKGHENLTVVCNTTGSDNWKVEAAQYKNGISDLLKLNKD